MIRSAFVLTALVAFGAAQAHAETEVVHTRDLNLSRPAHVRILDQRIQTAALNVCGAPFGSSDIVVRETQHSACYRQAVTTAMASVASKTTFAATEQ